MKKLVWHFNKILKYTGICDSYKKGEQIEKERQESHEGQKKVAIKVLQVRFKNVNTLIIINI